MAVNVKLSQKPGYLHVALVDGRGTICALSDAEIEALVADLSSHQGALLYKIAVVYIISLS